MAIEPPQGEAAIRLLQGYIWHPKDEIIELANYLQTRLEPDIHLLWDAMPAAPFTFFDDGTLSATQQFYQFTALKRIQQGEDPSGLIPWLAETLQRRLERTPAGVGWQVLEDLRELG